MIKMKKLIVAPAAKRDLRDIYQHISLDSVHYAQALLIDLTSKINWIAEVDFTGSPRDYISKGLRGLPFRKRCIYYRSYSDRIVVLRILHSAQDVARQKFDEQ